jgi:outer membrane protein OmpA-like peptidoglycan-associated protein
MKRTLMILLLFVTASVSTACLATRKFTRNEVKTSSDTLNKRIDGNETQISEVRDGVSGANTRIAALDTRTTQRFETLTGEVKTVDSKATTADTKAVAADQKALTAQGAADRAASALASLDGKFQNRNQFTVATETAVYFKFNSSTLNPENTSTLDKIAETLTQTPDALVVMEGRTDTSGDKDYNFRLGERRIEAVRRYLAVEKGVPVYKLHHVSFGAARPVAPNDSREGREKNRAVTMTVLVPRTDAPVTRNNNN